MLGYLSTIPSKLKILLDRLTSTRAANIDNIDTNVTNIGSSSTASTISSNLTTLDSRVDAVLSTRMGTIKRSSFLSLSVASAYMDLLTTPDSIGGYWGTLNWNKTLLIYLGYAATSGSSITKPSAYAYGNLSPTIPRVYTSSNFSSGNVLFQLVEFN